MTGALTFLKELANVKVEQEAFAASYLRIQEMNNEDVRIGFHRRKMEN